MGAISSYIVVQASSTQDLGEMVRESIGRGWTPFGSIAIDPNPKATLYQPMVKYTNEQSTSGAQ